MYGNTTVRKAGTIIRRAQAVALRPRGRYMSVQIVKLCLLEAMCENTTVRKAGTIIRRARAVALHPADDII